MSGGPSAPVNERRAEGGGPPTHEVRALTGGGAQAQLVLDGQTYTLRITRAGKLILTK